MPIPYPSPRVSQLDAHILDSELFSLLKDQLANILSLHHASWTFQQHPEIWSLVLQLLIYRVTVGRSGSTYGLALQNLRYTDTKGKTIGSGRKKLLLALIVGSYLYEKLTSYLYSVDETPLRDTTLVDRVVNFVKSHKNTVLSTVDRTLKLANLVNFTLFLVDGRYSTVSNRIFGITLAPVVTDLLRFNGNNVNFEFQNRQLVWNVMTEFLVFTLPLLQLGRVRAWFAKRTRGEKPADRGPYAALRASECAICHEQNVQAAIAGSKPASSGTVTNACVTSCGHIYCYVCIATRFNMAGDHACLRCGNQMEWFRVFSDVKNEAILIKGEEEEEEEEEEEDDDDGDEEEGDDDVEEVQGVDIEGDYEYEEEDDYEDDDYEDEYEMME